LILVPGLINLDFADVKTIMSGMGVAMMGTAQAEGQTRATDAANRAISSPLLEDASVDGARGVIINVTGGPDMALMEVNEALTIIQEAAHEDANIIFGAVVDPQLQGRVKITVIATGFDHVKTDRSMPAASTLQTPVDMSAYAPPARGVTAPPAPEPAPPLSSRLTIARRPGLDLPPSRPLAPAVGQSPGTGAAGGHDDLELNNPLDVPAFLRRGEG
ncbi:MAG: cell division protein FtsZ, partial [Acidobacteria bacterium]|nr:cell division protein FtsZ [Acidobacteriota bacterium]